MIELTTTQENELKELYKKLYNVREEIENECKGKQHSIFTCQIGKEYANSEIKFMLIGRCANGWPYCKPDTSDIFSEHYVEKLITADDFGWIVEDRFGKQTNGKGYSLQRSRFWTYSRALFEALTREQGTRSGIWQDHIVQSDLYKISPTLKGNPGTPAQRKQKGICLDLLKKEIEILKPTHILFATDEQWLFDEIKRELQPYARYDHIQSVGHYGNAKAIVTPHPGKNGIKKDPYAEQCVKAFKKIDT